MNNENRPLTPKIAEALIQELFAGQTAKRQQIIEKVDAVHVERGGQLSTAQYHPVPAALQNLKKDGWAANSTDYGYWFIFSEDSPLFSHPEDSPDSDSEESSPLATDPEEFSQSEGSAESETPRIESLEAFVKWVRELPLELPLGKYVYRGVSNEDYRIEASAYRRLKDENREFGSEADKSVKALLDINSKMIEEAKLYRHGWKNGQPLSNLDLLAQLQHNGAATCLIDFTRNPLVALWMACRESRSGPVDGKVSAIDIGPNSRFKSVSFDKAQGKDIDYFFTPDKISGYQLYHWQPNYQEARIRAQQSIFLFGGDWNAIEASEECVISAEYKKQILESLKKVAGISEDILFPDFQGFASQRAASKPYNRSVLPVDPGSGGSPEGGAKEADDNENSYLDLSLQAYQEGKTGVAAQHYETAMESNPADEDLKSFYRKRATFFFNKAYFDSAIYDYDELIRLDSEDADTYFWRGRAKFLLKKYEEAISDFDGAIGINPNADYHFWCGMARYHQGEYEAAVFDFSEAIALDPHNAYFRWWCGMARYNLKEYEAAVFDFDEAIALDPHDGYFRYWRGLTKYHQGEYEGAILDFDDAITLSSIDVRSNGYSYYWRGMAKKELNLFGAARNDFRMALMCAEEVEDYNLQNLIRQELGQ